MFERPLVWESALRAFFWHLILGCIEISGMHMRSESKSLMILARAQMTRLAISKLPVSTLTKRSLKNG